MPRKRRVWYPGAIYHVINRGNRKADIFRDRSDYIRFLEIVQSEQTRHDFTLHAVCLMTNHIHMLIGTKDVDLSMIIQHILGRYAGCYNRKYELSGHVFQGRFTSSLVRNDRYFLEVSRYIHMNPVKAQMVDSPADYLYSSYSLFVPGNVQEERYCREADPKLYHLMRELVDTDGTLRLFGPTVLCKRRYRQFVTEKVSHSEHEEMIQKEMRDEW